MDRASEAIRNSLHEELEAARQELKVLIEAFSEEDFSRHSLNPGWTNREILAHILFGFIITDQLLWLARLFSRLPPAWSRLFARLLDAMTGPFNWINALGARGQARVFTPQRIAARIDSVFASLQRTLDGIRVDEWGRGMHYPVRWDPNFEDFMTLEALFRYPVTHLHLHLAQISREDHSASGI